MSEPAQNQKIKAFWQTIFNWKFALTVVVGLLFFAAVYFFNEGIPLGITFGVTIILTVYLFSNFPKDSYQRAFFILIYLLVIGGLLAWYYTSLNIKPAFDINGKPIPPQIAENFARWGLQASLLRIIHVILGLVATTSSILAASTLFDKKESEKKSNLKSILMIIAAVSFSILSAFDLGDKANKERTAWREMNVAIMKYQQGLDSMKGLIDAYEKAEMTIGDVKPSPKEGNK